MRKICLLLLLLSCFNCLGQDAVKKVTKQYFRSDPFAEEFSSFLKHLVNDPTVSNKEILQRSDSSFFTFYGLYPRHNPFFFKPEKVEILLAETEVNYSDTADLRDTIFIYRLEAFTQNSAAGLKDIKKEFEKIHKNISRHFSKSNYQEEKKGEEVISAWLNYFVPTHALAPVSLMWENNKETGEANVSITVRMKISYNRAVLPASYLFN